MHHFVIFIDDDFFVGCMVVRLAPGLPILSIIAFQYRQGRLDTSDPSPAGRATGEYILDELASP